jgi:hypothetical protein
MQIVSVGAFDISGRRRDVKFRLGELNILTGKSKTGKSAILDIVEYCLGRNTVTIPTGVISEHASWYYVLVQFPNERVLICRPNPQGASTGRAMVLIGDLDLTAPSFADLEVNADTEVVKDTLTERLRIESFTIDPEGGSLRQAFEVSIRQALFFCFQNQGEIASRDVLFHRQSDNDIKLTIRDTLPYFLGAATPEQSALRRQIVAARRALQRTLNSVRATESDMERQDDRLTHLFESATSLDMFQQAPSDDSNLSTRDQLESILEYQIDYGTANDVGGSQRRSELMVEGRRIRDRIREIDDQLELLAKLQAEEGDSQDESQYQTDRLRALDLIVPKASLVDGNVRVCPLCDQQLNHSDETIDELRSILTTLESRLQVSKGASIRRQATIERLEAIREPLLEALRDNVVELDAVTQQDLEIAAGLERRERIAFLKGRVSQELERGVDLSSDLAELRNSERRFRGQLARLEEIADGDDPAVNLRAVMDAVSELMTDYARFLQLEGSEYFVRLDPNELTVAVQRPGGRVTLQRMGSAENWVGYHLVTHLALHHWFVTQNRPIPRFVMFDQPTQAFFPEEVIDATNDENADWEAVRRQFTLMRDVVASLAGELQVIVCDHANLADDWFQEAVVENWRNGEAFIPTDWLAGEEE